MIDGNMTGTFDQRALMDNSIQENATPDINTQKIR